MNQPQYNRVAVLLIGELRTWKYSSRYIIDSLSNIAKQVDWYLVTWDVDQSSGQPIKINDEDVVLPFQENNVNPVSYKILPIIEKQRSTFYNNAWLSKVANILKRQTECDEDFVYDNVVECRLDLYLRKPQKNWQQCEEFQLIGPVVQPFKGVLASLDLYFRSRSYTNDIMSNRYNIKTSDKHYTVVSQVYWKFNDHHWNLTQYIKSKFLEVSRLLDFGFGIVPLRDNFPVDRNLDEIPLEQLNELFTNYKKKWK